MTLRGWACAQQAVFLSILAPNVLAVGDGDGRSQVERAPLAVVASSDVGEARMFGVIGQGFWDPDGCLYTWDLVTPVELRAQNGALVGTVESANLIISFGRVTEIEQNFSILGGAEDTEFVVGSSVAEFDAVFAKYAQARSTASVTLEDTTAGAGSFAQLDGLGTPGTGAVQAFYNLDDRYSHMIAFIYAGAGGRATITQSEPAFGYRALDVDVTSLSLGSEFRVTRGDRVEIQNVFELVGPCEGDVNGDDSIDTTDLASMLTAFGACGGDAVYIDGADLNADLCVDMADLSTLLSNFGNDCGSN